MSRVNPYASIEKRTFESALMHLPETEYGPLGYDLDVPVRDLFADGTPLHDLWRGGRAQVHAGQITDATLPPRSGAVLAA